MSRDDPVGRRRHGHRRNITAAEAKSSSTNSNGGQHSGQSVTGDCSSGGKLVEQSYSKN